MKHLLNHMVIPSIVPSLFFAVAATPVELLGCRNRGLLALTIALMGALLGLVTAAKGAKSKLRSNPNANWWMVSTFILAIPAVYILLITR